MSGRIRSSALAMLALCLGAMVVASSLTGRSDAEPRRRCYDCHQKTQEEYAKKKFMHDPVKAEDCESCHKRHGFAQKLILQKGLPELCTSCHPGAVPKATEGGFDHLSTKDVTCVSCHDAHASDSKGLLAAPAGEVCATCHPRLAQALASPAKHKPFADGQVRNLSCRASIRSPRVVDRARNRALRPLPRSRCRVAGTPYSTGGGGRSLFVLSRSSRIAAGQGGRVRPHSLRRSRLPGLSQRPAGRSVGSHRPQGGAVHHLPQRRGRRRQGGPWPPSGSPRGLSLLSRSPQGRPQGSPQGKRRRTLLRLSRRPAPGSGTGLQTPAFRQSRLRFVPQAARRRWEGDADRILGGALPLLPWRRGGEGGGGKGSSCPHGRGLFDLSCPPREQGDGPSRPARGSHL